MANQPPPTQETLARTATASTASFDAQDEHERKPRSNRTTPLTFWTVLAVLAVVAVLGAQMLLRVGDDEIAAGADSGGSAAPDGFAQLGWVDYAGIDFAVVEARGLQDNASGRPIVVVELAVRNNRATQARVPEEMLTLVPIGLEKVDDEAVGPGVAMQRFEYTTYSDRLVIEPGGVAQALVVFSLPPMMAAEIDGFNLAVAEPGRTPAQLPLLGGPAEDPFPLLLPVTDPSSSPGPDSDSNPGSGDVDVTVTAATIDLDYRAYRAMVDHRLVVVDVAVEAPARARGVLDVVGRRNSWALTVDGGEVQPLRLENLETGPGGDSQSAGLRLVFEVPAGAGSTELMVGPDDGRITVVDLELPPLG